MIIGLPDLACSSTLYFTLRTASCNKFLVWLLYKQASEGQKIIFT